ncbi:aspartyl protease family protein At5g10770-like [Malania oleifera]|uniref:aspartyl protease family protein At5g10770-like n=1 Tax=Malania oleifera TaxID=397392 RepID=UPI0025ADA903|nr:aspartyl protease family protein At5g10770-like [Malania oleifera]
MSKKYRSTVTLPATLGLSMGSLLYVVEVGLGTPATYLSLAFDTGSDLTWTQCEPCMLHCYNQTEPIFNPSKSTSYSNVPCKSPLCAQLDAHDCFTNSSCLYGIEYGDKSYSMGFFAKEKLTLTQFDVIENFQFGCGQNNLLLPDEMMSGILGLAQNNVSIVSQTAKKYNEVFSYCLPSSPCSLGHLTFGNINDVRHPISFTPLVKNSLVGLPLYFIELRAISVYGKKLPINISVFLKVGTNIDSGTFITRLPPLAYATFRSAFQKQMSKYPRAQNLGILDTCYNFSKYNYVTVPKISLFFKGDVELNIDASGIIVMPDKEQACLAFAGNADETYVSVIGNFQQKTYTVIHDVVGEKLGFGACGCY